MKPCCENKENRVRDPESRPNLIVEVCKECKCKHRRLMVEPGMFGIIGKELG